MILADYLGAPDTKRDNAPAALSRRPASPVAGATGTALRS